MQTRVQVFTFRDGLLARLAHDLRLSVERFELRLDQGRLYGWFDPTSLRVDGVAHGEHVDPDALSAGDKRKIHDNLTRDVLEAAHHPRIELEARLETIGRSYVVSGHLKLHGHARALSVPLKIGDGGATAEVELTPSHYGITPYKALGGAIRLQDRVRIRVTVIAERDKLEATAATGEDARFGPN